MDTNCSKDSYGNLIDNGYIKICNQATNEEISQTYISEYVEPQIITSYIDSNSIINSASDINSFEDLSTDFGYKTIDSENILTDFYSKDSRLKGNYSNRSVNYGCINTDCVDTPFSINDEDDIIQNDISKQLSTSNITSIHDDNLLDNTNGQDIIVDEDFIESITPPAFVQKKKYITDQEKSIIRNDTVAQNTSQSYEEFIETDDEIPLSFDEETDSYIDKSTGAKLTLTEAIDLLESEGFRSSSSRGIIYMIILFALSSFTILFSIILIGYGVILLKSRGVRYTKKVIAGKNLQIFMFLDKRRREAFRKRGYVYIGLGILSIILFQLI